MRDNATGRLGSMEVALPLAAKTVASAEETPKTGP